MGFKNKILERKNQIHGSLTQPKVVKFCIISATLIWVLGVILAYLVAQLDSAGPGFDPAGYSIFINYISDLGSLRYTPMPVIINFSFFILERCIKRRWFEKINEGISQSDFNLHGYSLVWILFCGSLIRRCRRRN